MLVGENGQITPLGQPVHTQVRPGGAREGNDQKYSYQGKIRDVDLGADSSASAESEPEDVSTNSLLIAHTQTMLLHSNVERSHSH